MNDADIAASNLVLWGDPESNAVLKRIADKLPIKWEGDKVVVGPKSFPAETPRTDSDLSESAQPVEVRRAQQRVHVPGV